MIWAGVFVASALFLWLIGRPLMRYIRLFPSHAVRPRVGATAPTITLASLGLSLPATTKGVPTSGTITGATPGSTIALQSSPASFSVNSALRTISYDGGSLTGSFNLTLVETLIGAIGSPKSTSFSLTAATAPVVLGTLALSASSFTNGTTTSGTIIGATASSTIALASAPTGFTINSPARTWDFNGTATAGSGTLTLTETLSGASGSPKANGIGWTVAAGAGLAAPTLAWSSGSSTYDPVFQFPDGLLAGDVVQLDVDDDPAFGSLYGTDSHTVTTAEAADGYISFSGITTLSGGTSGLTYYARARITRAGATSAWSSNASKTLVENTAPTLSSATGTKTGQTTATVGVTTNEANGTLYYVITQSSTPPTKAQVKAGQANTGAAADKAGSQAISSTGAKTASITGLAAGTGYYAYFMHEDALGNQSTVAAAVQFITDFSGVGWTANAPITPIDGGYSTTATFTGVSLPAGVNILELSCQSARVSSMTFNGVTCAKLVESRTTPSVVRYYVAQFIITLASPTTANVVLTSAGGDGMDRLGLQTGLLTGASSTTPTATATLDNSAFTTTLQCTTNPSTPTNGRWIAFAAGGNGATYTWNGTEDVDTDIGAGMAYTGASGTTGQPTATRSGGGATQAMVATFWGP